jgi:hypothetical protein
MIGGMNGSVFLVRYKEICGGIIDPEIVRATAVVKIPSLF